MKRNGNRVLSALLAIVMVLVLLPISAAKADEVVEITSYADLRAFATRVNAGEYGLNATVMNDFTCRNSPGDTDNANNWIPICPDEDHPYTGTFDGQGYTITGLTYNQTVSPEQENQYYYMGMFGIIGEGGTVQNLNLQDCSMQMTTSGPFGYFFFGTVAGWSIGTITNCTVFGASKVKAVRTEGDASCIYVGGFAGYSNYIIKDSCFAGTGEVSVDADTGKFEVAEVGGIAGHNGSGTIETCFHAGAVSAAARTDICIGGIAGANYKTIQDCRHTGSVQGTRTSSHLVIGGAVGLQAANAKLRNCYVRSTVLATGSGVDPYLGAVAGMNYSRNDIKDCCYDTTLAGNAAAVNNTGNGSYDETRIHGLAPEQFADESRFTDWENYSTNWVMGDEQPELIALSVPVHLYANNGEDEGEDRVTPVCTPTRFVNSFTCGTRPFIGWNTKAEGDGTPYGEDDVFTLLPGETLMLYAQWEKPIEITNYFDLTEFAARVNAGEYGLNAMVMNDFKCPDKDWTPICPDQDHPYTGTFDGQGKVISGLNMDFEINAEEDVNLYFGLFGNIGKGGTVKDLYIRDSTYFIKVHEAAGNISFAGIIAGRNEGTISNCCVYYETAIISSIDGSDTGNYVGGIAGFNNMGTIEHCCVSDTYALLIQHGKNQALGGIAGVNYSGVIRNCFHNGEIFSATESKTLIGGIVGDNMGKVQNCRHTGRLEAEIRSGTAAIGGICGVFSNLAVTGTVSECYARTEIAVSGDGAGAQLAGGIIGDNQKKNGTVNCFFDNKLAPDVSAAENTGSGSYDENSVKGLAPEGFAVGSNFSGWENFSANWVMDDEQPELLALSAPVHLYANSDEDVVKLRNIPVCTRVKFANPFTYANHDFTGWNTKADGSGDPYGEDDKITLLRGESLSLSAQWREAAFLITFLNEDGTELQKEPVAAGKTPTYNGETPEKEPTAEHSYTFAGWKDENNTVYTGALPVVTGEATYTAVYTEREIVYGTPEWTWNGYESADATFTGTDGETVYTVNLPADTIFHMTTVEPDCEYPGIVTYTAQVTFLGKTYYNDKTKEIAKRDHIWVFDEFVWTPNEQGVYTVVANFHCERYASHTLEFIPIAGMATDPATCTEDGCTHYVAYIHPMDSPDGLEHEDKLDIVIPAHGHQWSAPDYERIETETGYDVYAIVRCYYDYSHRIEETVHATYEVITPPTLETEGLGRYTADFTDEHLWDIHWEVVIPKLRTTFFGEDVNALDDFVWEDGETLYRYDIRVRNLKDGARAVDSMQIFLSYDHAILALYKNEGAVDWMINDTDELLSAVWASETDVTISDDDIVLTLWFRKIGDAPADTPVAIRFTENALGNVSALSCAEGGTVTEYEVATEDGGILFETPIYGDANCDGVITAADAALVLRAIVGLSELSTRGAMNADVDGDCEITAADAALILRYVVGLIGTLPVE